MVLLRVSGRQLLVPAGALLSLLAPSVPAASAVGIPPGETVTGIVQTIIREQPRGRHTDADDTVKVLRVGTRTVPLTDGSLPTTKDGAKVRVTVAPASDGTNTVLQATSLAAPVTAAAISPVHQVYVALVRPAGAPASITDASARAMVSTVSQYWSDQTAGKVSFTTTEVQSYSSAYNCSDTYGMWSEALLRMPAASGAGKHLVVVAPNGANTTYGCAYGLGTVGAVEASGNKVFVSGLNQSLLAHELGHNLGLRHSNAMQCGTAQDMPRVGTAFPGCTLRTYDDLFDVMGYSGTNYGEGNLNAVHLDGMNLLPEAVKKIAANSGVTSAHLAPLSTSAANRTLKVTDPNGANYFVEYRTNSGRDAVAGVNSYQPAWGVRVMRDDPASPPSTGSYELDSTPTSVTNDYNRSVPVGGTFTAASTQVSIRVTAADAAGATLTITNGTSTAPPVPPTTPPTTPPVPPVPPTSPVPSSVTMSIPTRALIGAAITAATRVTDLQGQVVAGWGVTLQKMQKGTTTWKPVKSLVTTSTGAASYRFSNGVSGSYRWVTSAAAGAPSKVSRSVAVTSTARISGTRTAATSAPSRYVAVKGSVSSVPGPVVYVQYRYPGGTWRTGPRAAVTGRTVSGRIVFKVATTAYTRLYVRPGATYIGSFSRPYTTVIR